MESRTRLFGAAALTLFALPSTMPAPRGDCGAELEIDDASLIFEVNETDGDAEVVLRLKAPEGFRRLELEDPNGKRVFVLKAKGNVKQAVGLQQFVIESGEPNVVDVLATFPEGTYEVEGETVSGQEAEGELVLSHDLAPAPAYCPADGDPLDDDSVRRRGQLRRRDRAGRPRLQPDRHGARGRHLAPGARRLPAGEHRVRAGGRHRLAQWQHGRRRELVHDRALIGPRGRARARPRLD